MDVFDSRVCVLGEGPFWDPGRQLVRWIDGLGHRVLSRSLSGVADGFGVSADLGAAILTRTGDLVLCLPDRLVRHRDGAVLAHVGGPGQRSNDAKADPAGRLWHGTMDYHESAPIGVLYRLDPGAADTTPQVDQVTVSNGLGWSPDGTTMYYIDSPTHRVDRFDYDPATGEAVNRRLFAAVDDGFPDGLSVDAEGGVWVACWGGSAVRRFSPEGTLDAVYPLPTDQVTSCAFVGPELDLLVVTTAAENRPDDPDAGLTYVMSPGVKGQPVAAFAG
jgi:sugar lactone lactonase YvrE